MLLLSLLFACQAPFGSDRHALEGYRVATVAIDRLDEQTVRPKAVLIQDNALWTDQAATLHWRWLESSDELATWGAENLSHGIGAQPILTLPDGTDDALLGLLAIWPNGSLDRVMLTVPRASSTLDFTGFTLDATPETLDSITAVQMSVNSRKDWSLSPINAIPVGQIVRLSAQITSQLDPITRWMTLSRPGTFFELDATRTDWAAGTLVFDKEETVTASPSDPGLVSFLAIALNERGETDFITQDVFVGPVGQGVWTQSGRWLQSTGGPSSGRVWATLVPSDTGHTGLALDDVQPATRFSRVDPFGTANLPCEVVPEGPFDPNWLLIGACTREDVLGARVILELK